MHSTALNYWVNTKFSHLPNASYNKQAKQICTMMMKRAIDLAFDLIIFWQSVPGSLSIYTTLDRVFHFESSQSSLRICHLEFSHWHPIPMLWYHAQTGTKSIAFKRVETDDVIWMMPSMTKRLVHTFACRQFITFRLNSFIRMVNRTQCSEHTHTDTDTVTVTVGDRQNGEDETLLRILFSSCCMRQCIFTFFCLSLLYCHFSFTNRASVVVRLVILTAFCHFNSVYSMSILPYGIRHTHYVHYRT